MTYNDGLPPTYWYKLSSKDLNAAEPLYVAKEAIMKRIAQMQKKVDLSGSRCYVGVDVHKSAYYVALLSEDGERLQFSTPADPHGLLDKLNEMGVVILSLAHETGPTGYGLAWACQELGIQIVVAATSKIPRPISAGGKTDRLDAMKLAEFLAKGMLKSVTIPTPDEHGLREMERRRQRLIGNRRKLKQNIKSFLLRNGLSGAVELAQWTKASVEKLRRLEMGNAYLQATLESFMSELDLLNAQIQKMKEALTRESARQGKGVMLRNLKTIPGVGETVAQTFAAEIFRPERFERAEEICAYVGLAPIISQSGQSQGKAFLRQVGQNYFRSILVESAWASIRRDKYFRDFYTRIRSKTNLPQKAIVAVARKLLIVIWRVAVENRVYRPAK
jgi:transposase